MDKPKAQPIQGNKGSRKAAEKATTEAPPHSVVFSHPKNSKEAAVSHIPKDSSKDHNRLQKGSEDQATPHKHHPPDMETHLRIMSQTAKYLIKNNREDELIGLGATRIYSNAL
ncbi:uncharacterized protein G2W53_003120 [Senna tora]|uniref:Uncharacterized protein n=1 Tax=Senna tora TaxID=362788 RepID=A0A834XAD2_9FABA|nr:uncharacterized protein G2W53_003120 [Senna tora]